MMDYVEEAVQFITSILRIFNQDELRVSFNGGKDATVVLYLTHMAKQRIHCQKPIKCVYFAEKEQFEEVVSFMEEQKKELNLQIEELNGGFINGLETQVQKGVKAVIMGTRRDDPHGQKLDKITPTDKDYPPLLRVNPIIDWNYGQVWDCIKKCQIPYCVLYNQGYTYLGCKSKTLKNPQLKEGQGAWEVSGEMEQESRKDNHSKVLKVAMNISSII